MGWGFLRPSLAQRTAPESWAGLLGFSMSLVSPEELLLVLPHRNIAWYPLSCPLDGSCSPIHAGRDEACWTPAGQLDFLPPSLPPSVQGVQHSRPRRPCRATSAFRTGHFQVPVSSIRVKVHPKLLVKATTALMICLWLSYWEFNLGLFLPVDICWPRGRALHCTLCM